VAKYLHSFLTSPLEISVQLHTPVALFAPPPKKTRTHWLGGWVGPTAQRFLAFMGFQTLYRSTCRYSLYCLFMHPVPQNVTWTAIHKPNFKSFWEASRPTPMLKWRNTSTHYRTITRRV